jgi:hypothetical protein
MDYDTSKGASPFFLPGHAGNLFALYHRPADPASCRGGVLYVHPFANEMNYTRRAAAFRLLLWHPVVNGQQMMTDFLRLRILSDAIGERVGESATVQELRQRIYSGEPVEILGYEIMPHLGQAIEEIHIAPLVLAVATPIRWVEVVSGAEDPGRPLAQTTVHAWQAAGREATLHLVAGRPFWSSPRIQDSRDTTDIVVRVFGENHL